VPAMGASHCRPQSSNRTKNRTRRPLMKLAVAEAPVLDHHRSQLPQGPALWPP
jgi:hypothetical protein